MTAESRVIEHARKFALQTLGRDDDSAALMALASLYVVTAAGVSRGFIRAEPAERVVLDLDDKEIVA